MLIAVRAEVEDIEHWRTQFKSHSDLFSAQKISVAYMGSTEGNKVIAVFDTSDPEEFMRIFNDPATAEACLLYTSPSPRDVEESRMPSSA